MENKILIIANPKSGKGKTLKYIPELEEKLKNKNYEVDVKYTTIQDNATNIIINYKNEIDILIVCGGDGTLSEAIEGIHKTDKKVLLGYIPLGTTNDFAKAINVSFDKTDIGERINEYENKKIDVGMVNEKSFIFSVAFGIFSKSSYKVSSKWKNRLGRLAYILYGITELFTYKNNRLKIQTGDRVIEDEFIFTCISNSTHVGGFNMYKENVVKLDDGYFELLLVKKPKNFIELLKLSYKIMRGNLNDEKIECIKTNNVYIESKNKVGIAVDGEFGGELNKLYIRNENKYLDFILPSKNISESNSFEEEN